MGKRQKIDWDNIPVTVIEEGSPNRQNPYAQLSPEERMDPLARTLPNYLYEKVGKTNSEQYSW